MREYDGRQAILVSSKIDDYRKGTIGLGRLISDITALSEAMEDRPTGNALSDLADELEIVNASLLFDERSMTERERASVEATLATMKVHVESLIHEKVRDLP